MLLDTHGTAANELIGAAFTSSTWGKHKTALNCYLKYAQINDVIVRYPFELENVANFTAWALTENRLKSSSVKSYLSSLATIHYSTVVSEVFFWEFLFQFSSATYAV